MKSKSTRCATPPSCSKRLLFQPSKWAAIFTLLLGSCARALAGDAQFATSSAPRPSGPEAQKQIREIAAEQWHFRETVKQMMAIVESDTDLVPRQMAASALRDFRAVEAIPVLVRNLTSVPEVIGGGRNMVPGIEEDSCALALYDIGSEAVDPLVRFIRDGASDKQIEVAACTIAAISGKAKALTLLRDNIEQNASDEIRRRLNAAVRAIDSLQY